MVDHKLVWSEHAVSAEQRASVLRFFTLYARCKGLLNIWRRRPGRNACDGWIEAADAIAQARPRDASWTGPPVPF